MNCHLDSKLFIEGGCLLRPSCRWVIDIFSKQGMKRVNIQLFSCSTGSSIRLYLSICSNSIFHLKHGCFKLGEIKEIDKCIASLTILTSKMVEVILENFIKCFHLFIRKVLLEFQFESCFQNLSITFMDGGVLKLIFIFVIKGCYMLLHVIFLSSLEIIMCNKLTQSVENFLIGVCAFHILSIRCLPKLYFEFKEIY